MWFNGTGQSAKALATHLEPERNQIVRHVHLVYARVQRHTCTVERVEEGFVLRTPSLAVTLRTNTQPSWRTSVLCVVWIG